MTYLPDATDTPMTDAPPTDTADELFEEASGWYFRLQADDVSPEEHTAFAAWKAQGPAQERAWAEVIGLLGALRDPARNIRQGERAEWQRKRPSRWQRWAVAAAVVLTVTAAGLQTPWPDRWRADYATETGESRAFQLADGSRVQLNTDSALQISLDGHQRQVRLLRGEAWFEVTRDPDRPFVVQADDGWVKVVGTRFSVARRSAQTQVLVEQGKVEVNAGRGASVFLEPGRGVAYHDGQLDPVQPFDPAARFAWRQRQLVFRQQPLAEVVAELNRYWPGKVLVLGDALRERKVSGVFEIDKPEAVLKALTHTLGLRAEQYMTYLHVLRES